MARTHKNGVAVAHHDGSASIERMSRSEGRAMFDRAARFYRNISGDDFKRRYDQGEYNDELDQSDIQHLATLRRFAE